MEEHRDMEQTEARKMPQLDMKDLSMVAPPTGPGKGEAGRDWDVIAHYELLQSIEKDVLTRGWRTGGTLVTLNTAHTDMFAVMDLEVRRLDRFQGFCDAYKLRPVLGVLNSHRGDYGVRTYAGIRTMLIPSTVVLLDEMRISRHHHSFKKEKKDKINAAIDVASDTFLEFPTVYEQFLDVHLPLEHQEALLMWAGRKGLMPWSRIGRIDKAWLGSGEHTAWRLLLEFAEVVKMNRPGQPQMLPQSLIKLYREITRVMVGLAAAMAKGP